MIIANILEKYYLHLISLRAHRLSSLEERSTLLLIFPHPRAPLKGEGFNHEAIVAFTFRGQLRLRTVLHIEQSLVINSWCGGVPPDDTVIGAGVGEVEGAAPR